MRRPYGATALVIMVATLFLMNALPSLAQQKGPIKIGFISSHRSHDREGRVIRRGP